MRLFVYLHFYLWFRCAIELKTMEPKTRNHLWFDVCVWKAATADTMKKMAQTSSDEGLDR